MSVRARLAELGQLRDEGVISETEYQEGRKAAISAPVDSGAAAVVATVAALSQRCQRGHPMTFGTMLTLLSKHSTRPLTTVVCFACGKVVSLPAQYYACHTCDIAYCQECVAQGKNAPPTRRPHGFGSGLFSCFSDMPSCADSICYPCLIVHLSGVARTLQLPEQDRSSRCSVCVVGTVMCFADELMMLGMGDALIQCMTRRRLAELYLHQDPEYACTACLVPWIFKCCSISQVYREMRSHGHDRGGLCCINARPKASAPSSIPMGAR